MTKSGQRNHRQQLHNFSNIRYALNVSIDFLVGKTSLELDNNILKRLEDISKLSPDEKDKIFMVIDTFLRDAKARAAYK